jgi:hypothetical protein
MQNAGADAGVFIWVLLPFPGAPKARTSGAQLRDREIRKLDQEL